MIMSAVAFIATFLRVCLNFLRFVFFLLSESEQSHTVKDNYKRSSRIGKHGKPEIGKTGKNKNKEYCFYNERKGDVSLYYSERLSAQIHRIGNLEHIIGHKGNVCCFQCRIGTGNAHCYSHIRGG